MKAVSLFLSIFVNPKYCKASLINVLSPGVRPWSQFITHNLHNLGEHVCSVPGSTNEHCLWVVSLCHIADPHLNSQLGDMGKDKSQFLSRQDVCSPSEALPPPFGDDKRNPMLICFICPASWLQNPRGKKGEKLSQCV